MIENDLYFNIGELLGLKVPHHSDPETLLVDLTVLYEELSEHRRGLVSDWMLAKLRSALTSPAPFDSKTGQILSLANPWLVRSPHATEVRLLLLAAFREDCWSTRPFDELVSIGEALAEMSYDGPGADVVWQGFFEHFRFDPEKRMNALDVALAGLSIFGVQEFAAVAASVPFDAGIAARWEIYLASLIRTSGRAAVTSTLRGVLRGAEAESTKDLLTVCHARGMYFEDRAKSEPSSIPSAGAKIPIELEYANDCYQRERVHAKKCGLSTDIIGDKRPHVIYSSYADDKHVNFFQTAVVGLIKTLDRTAVTHQSESFAELGQDGALRRQFIYAFPTYLTSGKFADGYAVLPFGRQRRIGAIFSEASVLMEEADEATLENLVVEIGSHRGGRIYALQNYAMEGLVTQAAATVERERNVAFDPASIQTVSKLDFGDGYVPREIEQLQGWNSAFIFDLAGKAHVENQIARSTSGFLKNAKVFELGHGLDVPVGIGFNRYAMDWVLREGRWDRMSSFLSTRVRLPQFVEAMHALGIEVDGAFPKFKRGSNVAPIRKRQV